MASLEKDHSYSGNSQEPVAMTEKHAVPEVVITRRLRDREQLRKRKAEAEEKDTHQWVLGDPKRGKQTWRGRGGGRGRGRRQAPEPPAAEEQPDVPEEKQEAPVTALEETAEAPLEPLVEPSVPLVEAEELYTPKEVAESAPAGGDVCPEELEQTPRSEEPEFPELLISDRLEQEFYGSF